MNRLETSVQAASQASSYASNATYSGASAGVIGLISGIDWITIIGVSVAVGGFFVNWYYKIKENRRAEELHEMRKEKIKKGNCYED